MTAPSRCAWCGKFGLVPSLFSPTYRCMHCSRSTTAAGLVVPEPGIWTGTFLKQMLAKGRLP